MARSTIAIAPTTTPARDDFLILELVEGDGSILAKSSSPSIGRKELEALSIEGLVLVVRLGSSGAVVELIVSEGGSEALHRLSDIVEVASDMYNEDVLDTFVTELDVEDEASAIVTSSSIQQKLEPQMRNR